MPQVPVVTENRITADPLPGQRFNAPDIGAGGRAIGQGLQSLGRSVGEAAKNLDEVDLMFEEARAKQADVIYQDEEREAFFSEEEGFFNKVNADALNARRTTEERLARKRAELLSKAQSPRERAMLETVLGRRASEASDAIARHAATQGRNYAIEMAGARINAAVDGYARVIDEPPETDPVTGHTTSKAQAQRDTVLAEFARLADLNGWNDPAILADKKLEVLTKLHGGVIEAKALGDPQAALKYLDENKGEIDPLVEVSLRSKLQPMLIESASDGFAREIAEGTTPVVEAEGLSEQPVAEGTTTAAAARPTAMVAVNRSARPDPGRVRVATAFPRSFRDPRYDQFEARMEAKYGLPPGLLKSIRIHGERSNANQVSTAGARGVYQFIASTRQSFIKNYGIDPWRSPEEQVEAAAIHLRDDIVRHGSWKAAVAGYNGGPRAAALVARGGQAPKKETRDYLVRVAGGMGGTPDGRAVPVRESRAKIEASDLDRQLGEAETLVRERMAGQPPRLINETVERTKAKLKAQYAERKAVRAEAEDAEWDAAQEFIFAQEEAGKPITSVTQIPNWRNLPVERRIQAQGLAEANVGRQQAKAEAKAEPVTNPKFWQQVQQAYAYDPRLLVQKINPRGARELLDDEDYATFIRWSREGTEAMTKKPPSGERVTTTAIWREASSLFRAAGFRVGAEAKADDLAAANELSRDLHRWAQGVHRQRGEWPDGEAIRRQADAYLLKGTIYGEDERKGYYQGSKRKARKGFAFEAEEGEGFLADIPDNILKRIKRVLPADATAAQINRAYIAGKHAGDW